MLKCRFQKTAIHSIWKNENFIIGILLLLLLSLCFFDVVIGGKTFKVTTGNPHALPNGPFGQEDNKLKFYPVQSTTTPIMEEPVFEFMRKSLKKGYFPFWNPHQGCGYSLIGMIHLGFFFPLNFILYLLPNIYSWDILILLRFFLAGFLTYRFMRALHYQKTASFASGVIFMLSGPLVLNHYGFINVDILLPLLLLSLENLAHQPKIKNSCLSAISMALTFYAGHPEHIVLVNCFGFLYFLFRLLTLPLPIKQKRASIFFFFFAGLLALGLSAMVLFPFIRDWYTEHWHTHPSNMGAIAGGEHFLPQGVLSLVFPHFFQKEPVQLDFSRSNFWGYFGLLPSLLMFMSLFKIKKGGWLPVFFVFIFLFFIMKSHSGLMLFQWIGYLPVLRDIRFYFHISQLLAFCVAIPAGIAVQYLAEEKLILKKNLIITALFTITMTGLFIWYYSILTFYKEPITHLHLSSLAVKFAGLLLLLYFLLIGLKQKNILTQGYFQISLIILIALELFLYIPRGRARKFDSFPSTPYIEKLSTITPRPRVYGVFWALYPNVATGYELDDFGINQGLLSKRFVNFINSLILEDYFTKDFGRSAFSVLPLPFINKTRPFMNILNIKYLVAPTTLYRTFPPANLPNFPQPFYEEEVLLFENPFVSPRVFIAHIPIFEPDEKRAAERMKEMRDMLDKLIIINAPPPQGIKEQLKNVPLEDSSSALITSYSPNSVSIKASMLSPGFLVLSDTYHPDWKAFVNGRESRIFLTDLLIRSIFLPAGNHDVLFRFTPLAFYWGICVTLLFTILVLFLLNIRPK